MYVELKPARPHPAIDTIWYADSEDADQGYAVAPELGANLLIKLFDDHSEVLLSGAVTQQQQYPYVPGASYLGIRFQPGFGCAAVASLYELQNQSIEIPDSIRQDWNCLDESLRDLPRPQDQMWLLYRHALRLSEDMPNVPVPVQEALEHLRCQPGTLRVGDLARLTMVSERQLERLFRARVGLTPKQVCDTLRIRRVLETLWQALDRPSLSSLALRTGYVDQAHLAKDFRKIMGTTISDYLRP